MRLSVIPYVFVSILIGACSVGEQPTETEKALLERQVLPCSIRLNTQVGVLKETNLFSGLAEITGALTTAGAEMVDEASNPFGNASKSWKVVGEGAERKITMEFDLTDKAYECDFLKDGAEWEIYEVRRNGEAVFNKEVDSAAKEENERIKAQQREDEIDLWVEKGYSNVSYKYYSKSYEGSKSSSTSPRLKINCSPSFKEDPMILYDRDFAMTGEKGLALVVKNKDGSIDDLATDRPVVVDQFGQLGFEVKRDYSFGVNSDGQISRVIAARITQIDSIEIADYEFKMDDISAVPCL